MCFLSAVLSGVSRSLSRRRRTGGQAAPPGTGSVPPSPGEWPRAVCCRDKVRLC